MRRKTNDRGAAAVEFALVIPVLLLLILGIMEFSRLYNQQISLTNAARSAARVMAITEDTGDAFDAALAASTALNPPLTVGDLAFSATSCESGEIITATIDYESTLLTGWFGTTLALEGEGAMPCGG